MSAYPWTPLRSCLNCVDTWNPLRANDVENFRYIDLSSVDQDTKTIIEAREVACAQAPSRARQLVQTGDVLVSTVRPNLNGVARVRWPTWSPNPSPCSANAGRARAASRAGAS